MPVLQVTCFVNGSLIKDNSCSWFLDYDSEWDSCDSSLKASF